MDTSNGYNRISGLFEDINSNYGIRDDKKIETPNSYDFLHTINKEPELVLFSKRVAKFMEFVDIVGIPSKEWNVTFGYDNVSGDEDNILVSEWYLEQKSINLTNFINECIKYETIYPIAINRLIIDIKNEKDEYANKSLLLLDKLKNDLGSSYVSLVDYNKQLMETSKNHILIQKYSNALVTLMHNKTVESFGEIRKEIKDTNSDIIVNGLTISIEDLIDNNHEINKANGRKSKI